MGIGKVTSVRLLTLPAFFTNTNFTKMPGASGRTCIVHGCSNSSGKIQLWRQTECQIHKPQLHDECPCLRPYALHRFPGRAEDRDVRQMWIKRINLKGFVPTKNSTVCGVHFPDGRPTKEHPYPVLQLRNKYHGRMQFGRAGPKRRDQLTADHNYSTIESSATQNDPTRSLSASRHSSSTCFFTNTNFTKMPKSGRTCTVHGCSNSSGKIQLWRQTECQIHKPLLHDDCPCLRPYALHRFPGRAKDRDVRQIWIKHINLKDFVPTRNSTVCGVHFPDGRPTKEHPYPVLELGYKYHGRMQFGRALPKRRDQLAADHNYSTIKSIDSVESRQQVQNMNSPDPVRPVSVEQEKPEHQTDLISDHCMDSRLQVKMNSPDSARDISIKQEETEDHPQLNILHMVVCKEEDSPEHERSPSLLQEEPEPPREEILERPEEPDGSISTLLVVKSEVDDEDISSHCPEIEVELESDTEDSDDWGGDKKSRCPHWRKTYPV